MSDDARAAAERLITPTAHYGTIEEDVRLVLDIKMVATYTLEAADRQAALAADLGRVKAALEAMTESSDRLLRERDQYMNRLGLLLPYLNEAQMAIIRRAALNTAPAVAPGAEAGVAETCPDCGHLDHAGRRCLAGCSIWHCSAGWRAVAPGASDAGER